MIVGARHFMNMRSSEYLSGTLLGCVRTGNCGVLVVLVLEFLLKQLVNVSQKASSQLISFCSHQVLKSTQGGVKLESMKLKL